ncbi:hypothetical protein C8Q77DRAFT_589743 [Trametes polyzona]|nr:hypothetical protein C8Q77DRAFT_589743 [Trametes polyzona]
MFTAPFTRHQGQIQRAPRSRTHSGGASSDLVLVVAVASLEHLFTQTTTTHPPCTRARVMLPPMSEDAPRRWLGVSLLMVKPSDLWGPNHPASASTVYTAGTQCSSVSEHHPPGSGGRALLCSCQERSSACNVPERRRKTRVDFQSPDAYSMTRARARPSPPISTTRSVSSRTQRSGSPINTYTSRTALAGADSKSPRCTVHRHHAHGTRSVAGARPRSVPAAPPGGYSSSPLPPGGASIDLESRSGLAVVRRSLDERSATLCCAGRGARGVRDVCATRASSLETRLPVRRGRSAPSHVLPSWC